MKTPLKRLLACDVRRINEHKETFLNVEKLTGVPWQAVAAVWYRESFSVTPPKTPGGPFQFDPIPRREVMQTLLHISAPSLDWRAVSDYLSKGVNDFETSALFCACWLRHQTKFDLSKDHSDAAIKDALYGYNGRAWGPHPEASPYVYNDFDDQHRDMHIRGSVPDGHGGRKRIDTIDKRPGAFVVYKQLKGELTS